MTPPPSRASAPLPNPFERLLEGGWKKGVLRLAVAAGVLVLVLYWTGERALDTFSRRDNWVAIAVGAVMYGGLRVARIRKWFWMLRDAKLKPAGFGYLVRIQFVGMLANLLLPISEAVKIWAVCERRDQVFTATRSIVADTALHTLMIGVVGLSALGAWSATVGSQSGPLLPALVAGGLLIVAALVAMFIAARKLASGERMLLWGPPTKVLFWAMVETTIQLGIYVLAIASVTASVPSVLRLVAVAPLLFLSDLFMLTPSGLGVREGLFAVVFTMESSGADEAAQLGVSVGLVVSAMLLLCTVVFGGLALVLPAAGHVGDGSAPPS